MPLPGYTNKYEVCVDKIEGCANSLRVYGLKLQHNDWWPCYFKWRHKQHFVFWRYYYLTTQIDTKRGKSRRKKRIAANQTVHQWWLNVKPESTGCQPFVCVWKTANDVVHDAGLKWPKYNIDIYIHITPPLCANYRAFASHQLSTEIEWIQMSRWVCVHTILMPDPVNVILATYLDKICCCVVTRFSMGGSVSSSLLAVGHL